MKTSNKITMQDVAREAGVSTATVSRVLADFKGATSDATAKRVRDVATRLGYVVNSVAASLRRERTSTVGLIIADIANPFFGRLASGVENILSRQNFAVLLANSGNSVKEEKRLLRLMTEKQVDAVIMASSAADGRHIEEAIAHGMRIVLVDTEFSGVNAETIVIDNRRAAEEAVEHLLMLGHRRIAVISGQLQASFDRERLAGYHDAFAQRGLMVDPALVLNGASTYEGGQAIVRELLAAKQSVTAIFATNNLMTMGAIAAVLEAGLRIPDDVSIVGFDDMEWYPMFQPAITAVSQPAYQLGQVAAEHLLYVMSSGRTPKNNARVVLETELIIRRSTAPLLEA